MCFHGIWICKDPTYEKGISEKNEIYQLQCIINQYTVTSCELR